VVVEDAGRAKVMAAEGGGHVHLQGEPAGGRVELSADDADDTRLLQPAHPVQGRRGGQPHQARKLDIRAVRVGLQRSQQFDVNFVKINSHLAIHYLAMVLN
jgi:hypothetical protein